MSMLAERKTKKKWCLNPRGKEWAQDSNKFGQKMLEKMGWQHGKGLGPDGKGITEHIRVSYKNDSKGMGYTESNDQWTEHESNFTSLLASLNGTVEKPDEVKVSSLEKKSQTSRSRVHYHKFTRGKDLSRYSEKDLANIFGKKTFQETKNEVKEDDKTDTNGESNESKFLFNAGSMRDYFKKKLPNFGKTNGYVVGRNGVLKKEESESESEMRPSFGFGYSQKNDTDDCEEGTIKSEVPSEQNFSDDKPKKAGKITFVSYINAEENLGSDKKNKKKRKGEESNEDLVLSPNKKSKKNDEETPKKKSKAKVEDLGLSNPAFNPLPTPIKVQKHHLNTIQESLSESSVLEDDSPKIIEIQAQVYENASSEAPKKKKKSENLPEITEVCSSNEKKKRKKKAVGDAVVEVIEETPKKQPRSGLANPVFNGNIETESCTKSTEENPCEVPVKKKKKKESKLAGDNPSFVDVAEESMDVSQMEENPYEVKVKRKKKKKDEEQFALENPNFSATLENSIDSAQIEVNPYEVKVKEKKKKKKVKEEVFAMSNPSFNESPESSTNSSQVEENPYEVKIKKKTKKTKHLNEASPTNAAQVGDSPHDVPEKKKKKEKKEAFAIDNPQFDPNDSVEVTSTNNVLEVERKKKKSKKGKNEGGIVNPALSLDTSQSDTKEYVAVESVEIEESDLMLNIVTTPIIAKTKTPHKENTYSIRKVNSVKRTKSVRFSDVTQERIIPNKDDIEFDETYTIQANGSLEDPTSVDEHQSKKGKKRKLGLDNGAFDQQRNALEENLDSISKTIDMYQAEIENDINEKKLETFQMEDIMVGEVGNPHGENEKLPDGSKLKFKYAQFKGKTPFYQLDKTGAKKAYKHLIKGDIVLKFQNTNLHEIEGYAVKKNV